MDTMQNTVRKQMRFSGMTRRISSVEQVSKSGNYVVEICHSFEPEGLTKCGAKSLEECEVQFNHTQVKVIVYRYRHDPTTELKWKDMIDSRTTLFIGNIDGSVLGAVTGYNHAIERDHYKTDLTPVEAHIAVMNFANKYLKQ